MHAGLALTGAYLSGCAHQYGEKMSYLSPVIDAPNYDATMYWMDMSMQSVRDQSLPPPLAARALSLGPVAGFLAANGVTGEFDSHFDLGAAPAGADAHIAYGVAFSVAAAEAFQQPFIMERKRFLDKFADNEAKSLSVAWGEKVGKFIVQNRTNDGAEPSKANYYLGRYNRRSDALRWRPTGPFYSTRPGPAFNSFSRGLVPGMGQVTPWTMQSNSQFRVADFPDPMSAEFANQYHEVKSLGGKDSQERTADQAQIAVFWEDGPWGITPPGHFIKIGLQVLQHQPWSFTQRARAAALLTMTQLDAAVSTWDSKYYHDIVRPETMIRMRADSLSHADKRVSQQRNWQSLIPTPGFPAYTSGHSCFGAAGIRLTQLLSGTDEVKMSLKSPDLVLWPQLRDVTRHYTKLSQMEWENGMSRIYGGVHWQHDNEAGLRAGHQIAEQAFASMFPKRV